MTKCLTQLYPSKTTFIYVESSYSSQVKRSSNSETEREILKLAPTAYASQYTKGPRQVRRLQMITNFEELLSHSLSHIDLSTSEVRCFYHKSTWLKFFAWTHPCPSVLCSFKRFDQRICKWQTMDEHKNQIPTFFSIWSSRGVYQ